LKAFQRNKSGERVEELGGLNAEGAGKGHNVEESYVPFAPLDAADVVAM
jgi:hypothetical protein